MGKCRELRQQLAAEKPRRDERLNFPQPSDFIARVLSLQRTLAMITQCQHSSAKRNGHDRHGNQRFKCRDCGVSFAAPRPRPIGTMRIEINRAASVLQMLLEGMSIRAAERISRFDHRTITQLMVEAGERCKLFLEDTLIGLPVDDLECDEIWDFVGCKERTRERMEKGDQCGDAYCFTAIEANTKLLVAWHLGKRTDDHTLEFAGKVSRATAGRFQLSTDGYTPYRTAVPAAFGGRVDFAQVVKVYGTAADQHRYSPGEVVETRKHVRHGDPDEDRICTSHAERHNLSIRMHVRRLTRLTNAFSKKWENHEAMLALFFMFYNYCRPHMSLARRTPAMAAGLTCRVWSIRKLLDETATQS